MAKSRKSKDIHLLQPDLDLSYYVLSKNFEEFSAANEKYLNDRRRPNVTNLDKLNEFIPELTRLLHNYLASYASFIDHTRRLCKDVNDPEFEKEYALEKEKRHIRERTSFVKDLRNFAQHRKLPMVGFRVTLIHLKENKSITRPDSTFKDPPSLRINALLEWNGWTTPSIDFLSQQPQEMPILPFISESHKLASELFLWLRERVKVT